MDSMCEHANALSSKFWAVFCGFLKLHIQEENNGMRIREWFACVQEVCDAMEFTRNRHQAQLHRPHIAIFFLLLCFNTQIIWKSCDDDQMKKITTRNLTTVLFCGPLTSLCLYFFASPFSHSGPKPYQTSWSFLYILFVSFFENLILILKFIFGIKLASFKTWMENY
jgi:hypothetical protein